MCCGLDPAWLWLWPASVALIRPLAWEPPYAVDAALKSKKKKKKKKKSSLFPCKRKVNLKPLITALNGVSQARVMVTDHLNPRPLPHLHTQLPGPAHDGHLGVLAHTPSASPQDQAGLSWLQGRLHVTTRLLFLSKVLPRPVKNPRELLIFFSLYRIKHNPRTCSSAPPFSGSRHTVTDPYAPAVVQKALDLQGLSLKSSVRN